VPTALSRLPRFSTQHDTTPQSIRQCNLIYSHDYSGGPQSSPQHLQIPGLLVQLLQPLNISEHRIWESP
jgi:hypothetical protein